MGLQVNRYPNADLDRLIKIINYLEINKVLDVGANKGQYASQLRELGYKGKIVSFEPYSKAFIELAKRVKKDSNWTAYNFALGNSEEETILNISYNSASSSFLDMMPIHVESAPRSKYVMKEKAKIRKLDAIIYDLCGKKDQIFMKIDTQGYEQKVLEGAKESLMLIRGVQIEMSMVPLYKGEMLFLDLLSFMSKLGFNLFSLETGLANPVTGQLLQIDGIFVK